MNQSFIAPAFLRPDALSRARRLRRGLLLGGATGMALSLGTTPLSAQSLAGTYAPASAPAVSSAAARAALNRARAQEAAGSVALAAVQYREALAQSPTDASVPRELARFYTRQNRSEEARTEWKRVLILKSSDAEATRELAHLSRQVPVLTETTGAGVADVAPLPALAVPSVRTRALAQATVRDSSDSARVLLAQTGNGAFVPLPDAPMTDAPLPLPSGSGAPVAPANSTPVAPAPPTLDIPRATLAPIPPATRVTPIPFSLPARRTVSVSAKNRAAAYPFVNSGAKLLTGKRSNRALLDYQRAAQLDPTNPYALPGVATSFLVLGRYDEAASAARQFLSTAPATSQIRAQDQATYSTAFAASSQKMLRVLADVLTFGKHYREALGVNSFILSRSLDNFESAFQNGQIYTFLRSYGSADAAFQRAVSLKSDRADVWSAWGESLSYRRDPRAVAVFSRSLALQNDNPRASLGLGNYYLYSGQFAQAVPRLRTVLRAQPNNVAALISFGDALSFSGSPNAAVAPYSKALSLQPGNAKASLGLGRALVYSGRYAEGASRLNTIVAANPNNVDALEALALAQAQTGSPSAARSYSKLLTLQHDSAGRARTVASIGDLQLGQNDIAAATQSYALAAQLAPNDVKINLVYAQLLSYRSTTIEDWTATGNAARRVLSLAPTNPQAQALQLQAALKTGDRETANQLAAQLENVTPATAEDSLSLAQALRDAGAATDTRPADPALQSAASRLLMRSASQVTNPQTALRLADATRDAGDYPTATALYQRLIQAQPSNQNARLGLVKTLFYTNNISDAQAQANALLEIDPNNQEAQLLSAQLQMRLDTPESRDNAARIANTVLATDPSNSMARTLLGQALTTRARYADAVQQFQAAIAANPNNLEARLGLARNLNYSRDSESAIQQYRELIRLAPADATPRLELAQILLDRSRYTEAEALYNEVLVLRRSAELLPSVRRAIASNSLQRLSPSMRSAALMVPHAAKRRAVVDNPSASRADKRLLFAQNPTVSGPALPGGGSDLGAGVGALPGANAPATEAPNTAPETPATPEVPSAPVTTLPSTPLGGIGGPETAPPLQNGPATTPPVDTTPTGTTPVGTGGTPALPAIDSPVTSPGDARADQGAALRGLGESRRRQNQFTDAADFFNQALALNPNDYAARVGIAQSLRGQSKFADALQQVQSVLSQDASNIPALVLEAQLLADQGQNDAATTKLNALISQISDTTPLETYTQISLTLNSVGNYPASLELLNRAIAKFPSEPSIQRLQAQTLGLAGQTDASVSAYDALIATDPRDSEALVGKARVLNYANRLAAAETAYREALQVQGDNYLTQSELADVLGRRGNYKEAATLYQSALASNPNSVAIRVDLARLLRSAGQPADAEAALNQALEVEPNNVDALVERGLIRGGNGTYASALADLNRALTIAPNDESAQLGLAQVQSYAGQYTEAIASYQAFLTRNPTNSRARVELAQTLSYAGRSSEALTELDTVLTQTPTDGRALLVRAEVLSRSNRPTEAIAIYNTLLTQDPQNTQARVGLGDALLYAQRYNDAIRTYDQLLANDPNNTTVRISRARALSYAGRARESVAALRAIVATDATNVPARLALAEAGANSGNATLQRDSIGEYRAILKDNPDNINAQLGLARVLSYRSNFAESQGILNTILKTNPSNTDALVALADTERFAGKPFDAKKNYALAKRNTGLSAAQTASIRTGLSSVNRATSPSIGVNGSYYDDTNGVNLRSIGESAILRTRALTIGVLADHGRFRQNDLAERNRRNIGILLARQFGPFAAQLIVSRLKYSGVSEKTLYDLRFNRDYSPRRRINLSFSRRDIFESDLAVGSGITANIINLTGSTPLGKRFDLDATATYYRYSDDNSRVTLSPALMFRFKPNTPSLRIGLGYTYDNTDQTRNAPFVYYTPQNFNAAAILADYVVTTGRTRYGISGAVPLTGSTGQNGINRPADTLFGFLERDLGDNLDFNIRGGIVRVPNGTFRSNQISGGLNYYF